MPDKDGQLSSDEKTQALEWIGTQHGKTPPRCPWCAHDKFNLNSHVLGLLSASGETSFPAIMLHCDRCSFTFVFSAIMAGLIRLDDEEEAGGGA